MDSSDCAENLNESSSVESEQKFSSKKEFKVKKRKSKSRNRFVCDLCPKVFKFLANLNNHVKKIHENGSKMDESKTCEICGKTFNSLQNLKRHLNTVHVVLKTYECDRYKLNEYILN